MGRSELDSLHGIGAKRKKALLHHFGSVAAIKRAALADLQAVTGLSKNLSQMIYNHFHNSSD
jgi:excinuclease ABC subunit C